MYVVAVGSILEQVVGLGWPKSTIHDCFEDVLQQHGEQQLGQKTQRALLRRWRIEPTAEVVPDALSSHDYNCTSS